MRLHRFPSRSRASEPKRGPRTFIYAAARPPSSRPTYWSCELDITRARRRLSCRRPLRSSSVMCTPAPLSFASSKPAARSCSRVRATIALATVWRFRRNSYDNDLRLREPPRTAGANPSVAVASRGPTRCLEEGTSDDGVTRSPQTGRSLS